jgi:predicted protein tyrosine phosphatase
MASDSPKEAMIHVCSLARLHATVEETGARHVITLVRDQVLRPPGIDPDNHLVVDVDDITCAQDGYVHPCEEHVARTLDFAKRWDRAAPLVVHCWAGISRSTATAYAAACALSPHRNEADIAWELRRASRTARPNALIVSLADRLLGRNGRMIRAVETIGHGVVATEGEPFRLALG